MRLILPALLLTAACDGGDKSDDDGGIDTDSSCALEATLSDGLDAVLSYTADNGCSGSGHEDSVAFSFGINEPITVLLWLNSGVDITADSQSGLSATVIDSTFNEWQSASDG